MTALKLEPQISEKALASAQNHNTYIFLVPTTANKVSIGQAVASQFKVKVAAVRTANISGKPKDTPVKGGRRRIQGSRSDYKKAFVTLVKGESIKLFEEPKAEKEAKK